MQYTHTCTHIASPANKRGQCNKPTLYTPHVRIHADIGTNHANSCREVTIANIVHDHPHRGLQGALASGRRGVVVGAYSDGTGSRCEQETCQGEHPRPRHTNLFFCGCWPLRDHWEPSVLYRRSSVDLVDDVAVLLVQQSAMGSRQQRYVGKSSTGKANESERRGGGGHYCVVRTNTMEDGRKRLFIELPYSVCGISNCILFSRLDQPKRARIDLPSCEEAVNLRKTSWYVAPTQIVS